MTSPVARHCPAIYMWLDFCPVTPTRATVGARLVTWRRAQGLSQPDIARHLGIDVSTVSRAEQGRLRSPNRRVRREIEALVRMAEVRLQD
jgi:predicted transcriptional regulator